MSERAFGLKRLAEVIRQEFSAARCLGSRGNPYWTRLHQPASGL